MKLLHATLAVALTRLALATLAIAQTPIDAVATPVPKRLELGGTAGLAASFPELGLLASVPAGRRASVEVAASYMPEHWDAPEHRLAQIQLRIPFREDLRSRRSLTVGATRIAAIDDGDRGFLGSDASEIFPHAGVSLQWPLSSHTDFRFDGQGLLTFSSELPLVPRATAVLVWHPGSSR
jgi:hypothetical protein